MLSSRTHEHANMGCSPLFACSPMFVRSYGTAIASQKHEAHLRRVPRGVLYLLTAKGTQNSPHVALRGTVLRPALSGRSKIRPLQPPAPGARAVGHSLSAPSDNAESSPTITLITSLPPLQGVPAHVMCVMKCNCSGHAHFAACGIKPLRGRGLGWGRFADAAHGRGLRRWDLNEQSKYRIPCTV